jgi:hypothetical protein
MMYSSERMWRLFAHTSDPFVWRLFWMFSDFFSWWKFVNPQIKVKERTYLLKSSEGAYLT